jgi:hypothetical protein
MKDITPKQFRCGVCLECPAVFDLGDGRYAVKGELIGVDGNEATVIFNPEMIFAALKGLDRQANNEHPT